METRISFSLCSFVALLTATLSLGSGRGRGRVTFGGLLTQGSAFASPWATF
jgi:hypothetical protein